MLSLFAEIVFLLEDMTQKTLPFSNWLRFSSPTDCLSLASQDSFFLFFSSAFGTLHLELQGMYLDDDSTLPANVSSFRTNGTDISRSLMWGLSQGMHSKQVCGRN